jgi:hypothetical protein
VQRIITCGVCVGEMRLVDAVAGEYLCSECSNVQVVRPPEPQTKELKYADARRSFPTAATVGSGKLAELAAFKAEFLMKQPDEDPLVAPYWTLYQEVFSQDGIDACDPSLLKDFANSNVGASPGNMSVFNAEWNALGEEEAAQRTRAVVKHVLYGPDDRPLEDRITDVVKGRGRVEMKGFREALVTRMLCVVYPHRFLPILVYSSPPAQGKAEMAKLVFGLDLPDERSVPMSIGRLITWSNDLLVELCGDGFASLQHTSNFLWDVTHA